MDYSGLTPMQKEIVNFIASHPGVVSAQIANALKERHDTVSAQLSNIVRSFPNILTRTAESNGNGSGGAHYRYKLSDGKEPSAPLRKTKRARTDKGKRRGHTPDVLITVKVGKRESETLTLQEARALLNQLLNVQRFLNGE